MLEILINSTVALTLSTLTILIIKKIFNKWMTPEWHVSVWMIFLPFIFFMTVPALEFESDLSVRDMLPYAEERVHQVQVDEDPVIKYVDTETLPVDSELIVFENDTEGAGEVTAPEGNLANIDYEMYESSSVITLGNRTFEIGKTAGTAIVSVWAAGVIAFAVIEITRYVRLRKSLSLLALCDDPEILEVYDECRELLELRKVPALKTGADSSMLAGVFSKTIYIKEGTSKDEIKYVLMHELCHYKLGDVYNNLGATIGFVLSWFNPVIHIAFHTFRRDIEVRCDNVAIEKLGERREYAETLVRAAAGQKRFVLASTSFLGGEKEVVERVKRIAGARKRKVVLEAIGTLVIALAVVACTSVPASGPVENVALGENWQIDVPEKWLGDMRTVTQEEYNYEEADAIQPGSKRFYNKDGVEIAFAFIAEDVFSQEEYLSITKHVAPDGTPVSTLEITDELIEERVDGTVERYFEKGYTDIAKLPLHESEITMKEGASFFQYAATRHYLSSIGNPTEDFVITAMHRNGTVVILAARQGEAKADELLEYVDSFRTVRYDEISGMQLSGIEEFRNLPEGMKRPELTKEAYEEYVERTLQDAFSWYVLGDYPVEIALGGYGISDIEPITEVAAPEEGEKPGKADYYWDVPRWDIIYPHARAYKVTYSLTPENEKYYEGETEFERIAVFAVNTYVSPIYDGSGAMPESHVSHNPPYYVPADFYFLGFVDEAEADFYGQDQEILYMLDQWFTTLNPMSDPYYRTEYIGNAPEVAKVVNSLPLHEYIDMSEGTFTDNAIRIQTAEEPYGLTVHYTFNFKLTSISDEIWFTPVNSRQQAIMNSPINKYVESQLMQNVNQLYSRIGNVGEIDLVVHYVDERSEGSVPTATYTIHSTREGYYNY